VSCINITGYTRKVNSCLLFLKNMKNYIKFTGTRIVYSLGIKFSGFSDITREIRNVTMDMQCNNKLILNVPILPESS
jgi:hypothetical protein